MDEELIREAIRLDYSQLVMNNIYLHKENERLNKIINDFEKYIDENNKIRVKTDGYIWQLIRPVINCKDLKNKLQELKGEDKE